MPLSGCCRGSWGKEASGEDESFEGGLLEYPHYTRPQIFEGREIPPVLTSGDHGKVKAWRKARAEETTKERRPRSLGKISPGPVLKIVANVQYMC